MRNCNLYSLEGEEGAAAIPFSKKRMCFFKFYYEAFLSSTMFKLTE